MWFKSFVHSCTCSLCHLMLNLNAGFPLQSNCLWKHNNQSLRLSVTENNFNTHIKLNAVLPVQRRHSRLMKTTTVHISGRRGHVFKKTAIFPDSSHTDLHVPVFKKKNTLVPDVFPKDWNKLNSNKSVKKSKTKVIRDADTWVARGRWMFFYNEVSMIYSDEISFRVRERNVTSLVWAQDTRAGVAHLWWSVFIEASLTLLPH